MSSTEVNYFEWPHVMFIVKICDYYVSENVMNVWNVVIKVGGMFKQLYNNSCDMQEKLCIWYSMYQRFPLLCTRVLFALIANYVE